MLRFVVGMSRLNRASPVAAKSNKKPDFVVSEQTRQKTGMLGAKCGTVTLTQTRNSFRIENLVLHQTQRSSSVASTRLVADLRSPRALGLQSVFANLGAQSRRACEWVWKPGRPIASGLGVGLPVGF